ncbi:MaoC dehydratase-like protein [Actinocorallia herbida]|uniref:MaoC dehydratase-like protein n=1 Tax=Actinocorallia herbida TaxID=58109 RepID=A0A3N1CZ61_9ACTN|nr:MaoC/PaaZ C-terminal domain-containing protein [Actinocorallia herbida]ROO86583.1 MaoC dehydratase-like protein [Actinocorallia herbida]
MTDTAVHAALAESAATEETTEGTSVPGFTRTAGLEAWNRYAAVNDEFVGIHMDDEAGRAAGYPGAIGMGNLIWGWLHCMLDEWVVGRGRLEHLECRFKAPALKGDEVVCGGVVTARETARDGAVSLTVEVWADRQNGDRLVAGTARLILNA